MINVTHTYNIKWVYLDIIFNKLNIIIRNPNAQKNQFRLIFIEKIENHLQSMKLNHMKGLSPEIFGLVIIVVVHFPAVLDEFPIIKIICHTTITIGR